MLADKTVFWVGDEIICKIKHCAEVQQKKGEKGENKEIVTMYRNYCYKIKDIRKDGFLLTEDFDGTCGGGLNPHSKGPVRGNYR